jgi:hypothetical protein
MRRKISADGDECCLRLESAICCPPQLVEAEQYRPAEIPEGGGQEDREHLISENLLEVCLSQLKQRRGLRATNAAT